MDLRGTPSPLQDTDLPEGMLRLNTALDEVLALLHELAAAAGRPTC